MAQGTRDLLIRLLGDSSGMKKALEEADSAAGKHDLNLKNLAGTIGSTYAATKVIEFGKASVEAAAADEASQKTLETQLRNTTGASDEQVASVENFIEKMMFATGVTDDELRPAFSRLVTATKDSKEAQDLMGVAMDVSVGKGKPLQAVVEALGKAHDGNVAALARLGVQTKDAEGKTLSFGEVVESLNTTFGGQAAAAADTQAGKLAIMKARYGELQEQIGTALMPIMEQLVGVLSGVAEWFSSLDEDTQTWIVRIGLLGGGLVLATRAVNGIIGPLKQLGIIGKTAEKGLDGVAGSGRKISASNLAGGLTVAGVAAIGLGMHAATGAKRIAEMTAAIEGLSTVADAQVLSTFTDAMFNGTLAGKDLNETAKELASSNLEGAKRALEMAEASIAAGNASKFDKEMTAALRGAVKDEEAARKQAEETSKKYATTEEDTAGKVVMTHGRLQANVRIYGEYATAMKESKTKAEEVAKAEAEAAIELEQSQRKAQAARDTQNELAAAHERSARAARDQKAANEELSGELTNEAAFINLAQQLDDVTASAEAVAEEIAAGTLSAEDGMRRQALAVNGAKQAVLAYGEQIGGLPVEKQVRFAALIDQGKYDEVLAQLAVLERNRTFELSVQLKGATGFTFTPINGGTLEHKARGGRVTAGQPYIVGEERAELFVPGQSGHIVPFVPTGGGGITVNLTVNGSVIRERDLINFVYDGILDGQRRGELVGSLG